MFTASPLFEGINFAINDGDRIGLIGPNGAGKSTLLKILAGLVQPDSGKLTFQRGLKVAYLAQVPDFKENATIETTISEGLSNPEDWASQAKVLELISKFSLTDQVRTPQTPVSQLSGGWKKRVALARELAKDPDLLLLDEPTNHLDVESIIFIEELLARSPFATVTITHDRVFLQKVSTRILELNKTFKNGLLSIDGDYATFLEVKAEVMASQQTEETKLRNTLRRETEWLRRGARARLTKQQARIDQAGELKSDVEELNRRNQQSQVKMEFKSQEKSPKKLIEAKGISKSYDKLVVPIVDAYITPKSRIGLMGSNGAGKSTLIKILVGAIKPDTGSVTQYDNLKVAYFEQNREILDPTATLQNTICPKGEWVDYCGQKVHVKGYLKRFLFEYEQLGLVVGKLSGGEQSRLLLAKLMLQEANLLVLDEPTNDLDMNTLDVLEEVLKEFKGAVILVTHDRYFLDQVTNEIYAFGISPKGEKVIEKMVGLEQWEAWNQEQQKLISSLERDNQKQQSKTSSNTKKKKLSYNDQRELDSMESTIEAAEAKLSSLEQEIAKLENISNALKLNELSQQISKLQAEIARLYERWAHLTQ